MSVLEYPPAAEESELYGQIQSELKRARELTARLAEIASDMKRIAAAYKPREEPTDGPAPCVFSR